MNDELVVHRSWSFTETVCGILFNTTVPCMMTNIEEKVTCQECLTILAIWKKNKMGEIKNEKEIKKVSKND